jgi:3D (Asp-Asp-Asp) domain-containing protein
MKKIKNYIPIIAAMLIMFIGMVAFAVNSIRVEAELESTKVDLQLKEDALIDTQKDLQFEIEKSTGLSEKLGGMMGELDELNDMLSVVKSEEYNVAYLGEFVYTYYCDERRPHICGGAGYTASGAPTEVGTTIAVDPTRIPLGSMVYIEGIGLRIAQDTGGAVKGNKIDILLQTHDECFKQTIINGGVWIVSPKTP